MKCTLGVIIKRQVFQILMHWVSKCVEFENKLGLLSETFGKQFALMSKIQVFAENGKK